MRRLRRVGLGIAFAAAVPFVAPGPASACTLPGTPDAGFEPPQDFLGTVTSAHQGAYVQIPFNVPAGTTAIRIRYCNDQPRRRPADDTLDMGVYEPLHAGSAICRHSRAPRLERKRRQGLSDRRQRLLAAEPSMSPTARPTSTATRPAPTSPGPIPPGQWTVELGLAALVGRRDPTPSTAGCGSRRARAPTGPTTRTRARRIDAAPASAGAGWYAGDVHAHGEQEPGNALMSTSLRLRLRAARAGWRGPRLRRPRRPQQRRQPRRDRPATSPAIPASWSSPEPR